MVAANANFNEITATTLKKRRKKFNDNVLNHNALLRKLATTEGGLRVLDGGETIVEELEYAENQSFKYYSGYELLDMTPAEVFSAAEFNWRQAAVVIGASGLELRKNAGSERMIDLLDARMRNGEKTMKNNLSTGIYSNGTAHGGKQVGGLQHVVANAPGTGTIGGIDRVNFTFWRNMFTDGEVTDSTVVKGLMNAMWLSLVRGADHPDLIVADPLAFSAFWDTLSDIQRITTGDKGTSGYKSLEFNGPGGSAPVFHDDAAPTKSMYFLNTQYLHWVAHRYVNMEPLARRDSWNQDAIAVPIIFMGNLTCGNCALQGVIFDGD